MAGFNLNAENHPCMQCSYGGMWNEQKKPAGNKCLHPLITKQKGLYYGRFHSLKKAPNWCPINKTEEVVV